MKKILTFLTFLFLVLGLHAESKFYFAEQKIEPGETITLGLNLLNEANCEGFQLKITLPEGLSFVFDDEEEDYYSKTNRTPKKFNIDTELKAAGELNLVGYLSGTSVIQSGDGAIITLLVKAAEGASLGTGKISLSNAEINLEGSVNVNPTDAQYDISISGKVNVIAQTESETKGTVTGGGKDLDSANPVTLKATPKDGYDFVGWFDGETQVSTDAEYTFKPTKSVTLTAKFAIQTFEIIFQNEDGSEIQKQTQNYGTATIKPTDPTKEGYTFTGWNPAVDATVTSAKTYKATFSINKYKIKFVLDNGSADVENELDYGATITPPTNPTKEGYTFTGWNPAVDATVPATNKTYTAQYEVNKWTVSFRYLAADEETWQTVDKTNIAFGTVITTAMEPDRPTLPGMPFLNWKDADGNALVLGTTTVPDKNVVYTANYDVSKYTITYDVDGTITNVEVPYKAEITPITDPTKAGHDFAGWTWKKTADGSALSNMAGQKMPAYALTATATWNVHSFTIIFQNEDGSEIQNRTQNYGTTTITPTDPTKEGYTFTGWDPAVDATVTSAKTYKATFAINKYKIKFVQDDGTTVIKEDELEYNAVITAPADPTKEGYTFTGWSPAVDATVPATNKTYKATYAINQYTVKFIHPKDNSTIQENLLNFGAAITAPATPEWSGHTFQGWALSPDLATQVDVATTVPARDLTYVAFFETTMYKITYKVEGQDDIVRQVGFEYPLPAEDPTPEVEGYNFKGWTWSTGDKPATMPANDITATAVLEIKTNTVKFFEEDGTTQIGADFTGAYNSDITAPDAPAKQGYTFDGWTIIGGDGTVLASVTKIPGDNTSYQAHYKVNKYKLVYKVDGEVYKEEEVEYGKTLVAIDAPEDKEGYTFSGWSEFPSATMPDAEVTITGTFNINQYTITFVTLNEDGSVKETIQSTTQDYATAIVAPNTEDAAIFAKLNREEEGWIFKGWALQEAPETQVEVAEKVPAKNLTYVAYYVPNIVYVFYIVDSDTVYTETVDYKAAIPAYKDPVKEGHTFSGWTWRNEDGSKIYEGKPATMPAENVVAEGTLNVNKYLVTFISEGETIYSEMLDYGTPIEAPKPAGDRGYELVGWDPVLPATVPAKDVTFTAQFKLMSYTIIYILNGQEYKRVETPYGTEVTPLVVDEEGYTFSGWENLPTTMLARDVEVFGSLTINQYKVVFMDGENLVKEETLDYGTEIVAPEAPVHEGFNFVEWENLLETVPAYDVVFEAVYKEVETIEPVEEETKVDFAEALVDEAGEPVPLNNAVVNNTYYNFDSAKGDGYDTTEKCLVLNTSTSTEQMAEVAEAELGSSSMANNFAGIVLSVKGEGSMEIDCQTIGEKELFVKVGDAEPQVFKKNDRGLAEITYNADEDTPVYIYASSSTGTETADDALKIWSVNIVPGPVTPVAIKTIREAIEKGSAYTIDGRKLNTVPTKKGFYIINGKKVMIK